MEAAVEVGAKRRPPTETVPVSVNDAADVWIAIDSRPGMFLLHIQHGPTWTRVRLDAEQVRRLHCALIGFLPKEGA